MVILNIFLTSFFAAISPGPNLYFVISQTNISKKNGFFSAFGVIVGVLFWLILLSLGFKFFLKNKNFTLTLNVLSSIYLFYLGGVCLLKKKNSIVIKKQTQTQDSNLQTFFKSLLLALFNIEIAAFYGAIFTNILSKKNEIISILSFFKIIPNLHNNYLLLFLFFSICFLIIESFVFFSCVFVFSFFDALKKYKDKIDKILGVFIIYYSLSIFIEFLKAINIIK
jgi:threonine/homoserine/homoserine lactone efflux protein